MTDHTAEAAGEASAQNTEITEEEGAFKARTSKRVAWILDECIRIPGTKIKFGLDPIVGLIPGAGEAIATIAGATVLGEAGKKGIPFKTFLRMGGNMLLNAAVGTVPLVGDLFSVWFKSNKRNYELLNEYLESEEGDDARGGWWPLLLILVILGIVVATYLVMWVLIAIGATWFFEEIGDKLNLPLPGRGD